MKRQSVVIIPFFSALLFVVILFDCCNAEESSQIERSPNLSTEDLTHLLSLLDSDDQNHLLNLGDLLLEHDHSFLIPTIPSTTSTTTTTPKTTTTTTTTTTTQPPPPPPPPVINRRQDSFEALTTSTSSPTNDQLVNQLSLFNSLLQSLSTNATTTTTEASTGVPQLTAEQLQLLQSLFGVQPSTTVATLLKRQTTATPTQDLTAISQLLQTLATQNAAVQQQQQQGNLQGNQLLLQALANQNVGQVQGLNLDHLKNFQNSNANMEGASSNQISGLLTLLGTLGTLGALAQPQQNSLFNFGQQQPTQQSFLGSLLNPVPAQTQQSPNIFGNLFAPQQQVQPQVQQYGAGGGLGSLIAPGIGSIISTVGNMLGAGAGGKPRVRGKGVDTRVGVGYRLGDAADAQIMFDIGPQIFTDKINNEHRLQHFKRKRQDPNSQNLQAQAQLEKQQQQQMATRRTGSPMSTAASRRHYQIQNAPKQSLQALAQEAALKKELREIQEMQRQLDALQANKLLSPADLYQIGRSKQVMKRASDSPIKGDVDIIHHEGSAMAESIQRLQTFKRFPVPPPQKRHVSMRPLRRVSPSHPLQPPPPPPGYMNGLFGRYRGSGPVQIHRPPSQQQQSASSNKSKDKTTIMSRWDMTHRFDNFKNTNGELVMTDTNSKDRFYARNRESGKNTGPHSGA